MTILQAGKRAAVLLPRPFDAAFDYIVPAGMRLELGSYVTVPFGAASLVGVVWGEGTQNIDETKCKSIEAHHNHLPPMGAPLRRLIDWCADYTLAPRGMVLKMALTKAQAICQPAMQTAYSLQHVEAGQLTPPRKAVIRALQENETLTRAALLQRSGASAAVISGMLKCGMLKCTQTHAPIERIRFSPRAAPPLRAEQRLAADTLKASLGKGFEVFALEGVTGSGKTEVYFDVIAELLKKGEGQVLVLLPEIALTAQWMQRFEARFGQQAALWHSSVSEAKRKSIWQAIAAGSAPLVVGARSALFLPYRDLRLIIVDEEHEPSYKQEDGVLYQARDMAVVRAQQEQISIVLCSATLSLETRRNAERGKYRLLELKERHSDYHEPLPELIDLRADKPQRGAFIAPTLREAMRETLDAGHQAMLFLNRRGYAPLLLCRSCGHRFACPNCSSYMVQHSRPARLQCHHCDWRQSLPKSCPECAGEELAACGPGVERIEEEARALFPDSRIITLSSDGTALGEQIENILSGQTDIVIGTQMLAKGHHFPKLALVGVIDGDLGLDGGDLRAGERSYQLLHQLAGRAGRDAVQGRVLIQTSQPEHPLMQALSRGDREGFMRAENAQREAGGWPPYGRLAGLLIEGFDEAKVRQLALEMLQRAPRYDNMRYLGPAPAPIARARNRYRYRILVKADRSVALSSILREWMKACHIPSTLKVRVDIDPYQFH